MPKAFSLTTARQLSSDNLLGNSQKKEGKIKEVLKKQLTHAWNI